MLTDLWHTLSHFAFREILFLKMIDKQTFLNKGGSEVEGLLKRRELPRVLLITSVKPTISNETENLSIGWDFSKLITSTNGHSARASRTKTVRFIWFEMKSNLIIWWFLTQTCYAEWNRKASTRCSQPIFPGWLSTGDFVTALDLVPRNILYSVNSFGKLTKHEVNRWTLADSIERVDEWTYSMVHFQELKRYSTFFCVVFGVKVQNT